ncbi:MAG: PLP-dependent cysteine synthase family protein [Rhodoferax sp.]
MNTALHPFQTSCSRRAILQAGLLGVAAVSASSAQAIAEFQMAEATHLVSGKNAEWVRSAIKLMWQDRSMAGITPLVRLQVPFNQGISIYLKNEAKSPSGSLKHRVAWALIMSALVDGKIGPQTRLYEASSGNTAIGEAYFARLLGLSFTAVMRPGISEGKILAIRSYGGRAETVANGVAPSDFIAAALARDPLAYNLDQFANTQKALDHFDAAPGASMNMASEIFRQLEAADQPCPTWFVAGAGSGGTATSIGRYLRKWADYNRRNCPAQLVVVDPEDSALFEWFKTGDNKTTVPNGSRIEGIGTRGPVLFGSTFSLLREGISRMMRVPDADSVAAMHLASKLTGQEAGPSTGTNLYGALQLVDEMNRQGRTGSVVSIICDDGSRYRSNYYDPQWINASKLDYDDRLRRLELFWASGRWS